MEKTIGDYVDSKPLMEILNHPDFYQLKVFNGFEGSPDYWEISFESKKKDNDGTWLTFNNQKTHEKYYKIFKIKNKT